MNSENFPKVFEPKENFASAKNKKIAETLWNRAFGLLGAEKANAANSKIVKTEILDASGNVDEKIQTLIEESASPVKIKVLKPERAFKPGRYSLRVEMLSADGTQVLTSTQNFTWGVLAINANKSIYSPDETAKLSFAVLDENGNMVCNAKLKLEIRNLPAGEAGEKEEIDELSTENGKIKVNSEVCSSHEFTLEPDYEAEYKTGEWGNYEMTLTAETANGAYTIQDSFEVSNIVAFDVERTTATRIFPKNKYPVIFDIEANQDFKGKIIEEVPNNFEINNLDIENSLEISNFKFKILNQFQISNDKNKKQLIWDADIKKGDKFSLGYQYDAPDVSPQFYLLGPLRFYKNSDGDSDKARPVSDLVFGEARQWQIAADLATSEGDGLIFYAAASNTTPQWRTYSAASNDFSSNSGTIAGAQPAINQIKTSPTKQEAIAGYQDTSGNLRVLCYDGTNWTEDWTVAVAASGTPTTRAFDIAYETSTGDVTVAYSRNTAAANALAYRTKAGSAGCGSGNWSGASNFPTTTTVTSATVKWVRAARDGRSGSDLSAWIWLDNAATQADLGAAIWSGSAFNNFKSLETSMEHITAVGDTDNFDVQYESLSGDVMVVWGNSAGGSGVNGYRYNTCTGGTSSCTWLGSAATMPTTADGAMMVDLSADPLSDKMAMAGICTASDDMSAGYWDGGSSGWTGYAGVDNLTETTAQLPGMKLMTTGWLTNNGNTKWYLSYDDSTGTGISYKYAINGGAITSPGDYTSTPAINDLRGRYDTDMNPFNNAELIQTLSDSTNQIVAFKLTMDTSGNLSWSNMASAAFLGTKPSHPQQGFSFTYWRYIPVATITVSGSCYQYDQSTPCADSGPEQIAVAIDGVLQAQTDGTVDDSWIISGITQPAANATVTVFINGEATANERATAVTKYNSGGTGNIGGVVLYQRHLTIGSDQNTTVANSDMDDYDYNAGSDPDDADIIYDVDASNNLTVDNLGSYTDERLWILASNTYQPDSVTGRTNTAADLQIVGTLTANDNTFNISGNWTNNGAFTAGTSTVNMNGGAAQAISGSASTPAFNNLNISNAAAEVSASANFSVGGTLTVGASAVFNPGTAVVISGAGTLTGSGTAKVSYASGSNAFFTQYTISTRTLTNLTVDYTGSTGSGLVITDTTYGNAGSGGLKISGSIATGTQTATVGGVFTVTGTFTPSAGTITMNNGSSISKPSGTLTFQALTIAASATVTANNSFSTNGNFTVNGSATFTPDPAAVMNGTGTLTGTGTVQVTRTTSTPDFSSQYTISNKTLTSLTVAYVSASAQTVSAVNYGNLLSSGAGDRTLASTGTIGISGSFVVGTNTYTTTGSTVNYNGAGQTVGAISYNNLTLSGSGTVTMTGVTTVGGDFTASGGTATVPLTTIGGNFLVNGAAITTGGNLAVTGSTTLSSGTLALGNFTFSTGSLVVSAGTITTVGYTFTVSSTTTVNGGTLALSNNTGTKLLTGAVAVSSGVLNGASTAIEFRNGITQSSSGSVAITGTVAFTTTASQALAGTIGLAATTIGSGVTLTNNGTTTVSGLLTLTGNWAQANGSTLNYSSTSAFSGAGTFSASTATNTVNYSASGTQTVKDPNGGTAHTYSNLGLSGTSAKTMTGVTTVNNFTMSGSASTTNNVLTTVNGNIDLSGTASTTTGAALAVTGTTTVGTGASLAIGAFTTSMPNITVTGTGTMSNGGTLTVSTTLGGTGTFTNGAAGTLNFGSATAPTVTTFTMNTGGNTMNYTAASPAIRTVPYHHLGITGSGTVTGGNFTVTTIGGNLTISGSVGVTTGAALAVTGTTSVGNGTSLAIGALTTSMPNITITSNGAMTNGGTLTVSTTLAGTGSFTNLAAGTLNFGGSMLDVSTFTANASGNTVNYNASGTQTVKATATYHHLTLSGTSAKTLQTGTTSIGGNFTLSGTASTTLVVSLAVAGQVTVNTGTTLNLASSGYVLTLSGSGTGTSRPLYMNGGTLTAGTNSTVKFTGGSSLTEVEGTSAGGAITYNNLEISPASTGASFRLGSSGSQTINISGNFIVNDGSGTETVSVDWDNFDPYLTVGGNLTMNDNITTWTKSIGVRLTFSGTTTPVTWIDNNSSKKDIGNVWVGDATNTKHIDLGSAVKVTTIVVKNNGTFDHNGSNNLNVNTNLALDGGDPGSNYLAGGIVYLDGASTNNVTDENTVKKNLGTIVVDGAANDAVYSTDIVATKVTIGADDHFGSTGVSLTLTGSGTGDNRPLRNLNSDGGYWLGPTYFTGTGDTEIEGAPGSSGPYQNSYGYYEALYLQPASGTPTYYLGTASNQHLEIEGDLVVGSGSDTVTANWTYYDPELDVYGDLILASGGSWAKSDSETLYLVNDSGNFHPTAGWSDANGTKQDVGNVIVGEGTYAKTATLGSAVKATNLTVANNGTFSHNGANDLTLYGNFQLDSGSHFTKATGAGKLILEGDDTTEAFEDLTSPQQDMGAVQIGLSPGVTNLKSDMTATSLTINANDTMNTKGWDLIIGTGGISIVTGSPGGTLNTVNNTPGSGGCSSDGTIVNDSGNFTIGSGGVFTKDSTGTEVSLVKMPGGTTKTFTSASNDIGHFQTSTASTHIDLQDACDFDNVTIDGSTTLDSNSHDITAAGNWADSGSFSAGTATVTLDGGSANQSVTTGSSAFYNLTSTNTSASPGVTFTNGTNASNLFKDVTAASTLTFTAGTTSTLADIQLHGAADPNYVTIRSTTTSAANWHVTKTAPQNDVSYVSVSYNNASGSGDYIDATNGTNYNGGNNDSYWHFTGVSLALSCAASAGMTDYPLGSSSDNNGYSLHYFADGEKCTITDNTTDPWTLTLDSSSLTKGASNNLANTYIKLSRDADPAAAPTTTTGAGGNVSEPAAGDWSLDTTRTIAEGSASATGDYDVRTTVRLENLNTLYSENGDQATLTFTLF